MLEAAEGHLQAELVERFTRFVYWPSEKDGAGVPFEVCAYGTGHLHDDLRRVVGTHRFKGRETRFRAVERVGGIAGCHVLFVHGSAETELEELLAEIAGQPILTVADTPGFARRGVIIGFRREGEHVGFEINIRAAGRAGLEISSRLLQLARPMETEP